MKRLFWLGAGIATAVLVSRWWREQRRLLSPANLGAQVGRGAGDLGRLVRESLEAGREEMERVEAEIRAELPE